MNIPVQPKPQPSFGSENRIGRRMMWLVVSVSAILMIVVSAIQLLIEYRGLRNHVDQTLNSIEVYVDNIADSLWNFDSRQLNLALEGLSNLPYVAFVQVTGSESNGRQWQAGTSEMPKVFTDRTFPLFGMIRGNKEHIGSLNVVADLSLVRLEIAKRGFIILVTNSLKTTLVVIFMLLQFRRIVIRQLREIATKVAHLTKVLFKVDPSTNVTDKLNELKGKDELEQLGQLLDVVSREMTTLNSDRDKSENSAKSQAAYNQTILDNVSNLVISVDSTGSIQHANQKVFRVLGRSEPDLMGKPLSAILPEQFANDLLAILVDHHETEHSPIFESEIKAQSGANIPVEIKAACFKNNGAKQLVLTLLDLTQQKQNERQIRDLAYLDQLTMLPNRALFQIHLNDAMFRSERNGLFGALIYIDFDNFKYLNDSRGHSSGDEMLKSFSERMKNLLRQSDHLSRVGGDEFILLVEDISHDKADSVTTISHLLEKVQVSLQQSFELIDGPYDATVSMGVSLFLGRKQSIEALMAEADMAMYSAKNDGRNAYRFFDEGMQKVSDERHQLEMDMRHGLANGQFSVVYQPQYNYDGLMIGVEALLRWKHPEKSYISPAEFIPVAERCGLIHQIGNFVIRKVCRQINLWETTPRLNTLPIAVNVSTLQFHSSDFDSELVRTVTEMKVSPTRIKLELTESILVDNLPNLANRMHDLKQIGFSFALDDFGTGYSSLSYLKHLPIDQLKIDRSFVMDIETDANDASIVSALITMSKQLGIGVIAEGVETITQVDFLMNAGCNMFQGYYFGKPMSAEQLENISSSTNVAPLLNTTPSSE